MITFIEKPALTEYVACIRRTYVPVFMVKNGTEYFIMKRAIDGTHMENKHLERIKSMLLNTEGRYFKFYGAYDDPFEMLASIKERGYTLIFGSPAGPFCDCPVVPYGAGFTDFSGGCCEIDLTFNYRIFDPDLLTSLRAAVQDLLSNN